MQLEIIDQQLKLHLAVKERLAAVHIASTIAVPLPSITHVSTVEPKSNWNEIRAPGSFVPNFIKAGTYYTARGREFWYVTKSREGKFLTLDLKDEYYKRIVLAIDDHQAWCDRLQALIPSP
ncbi:hypothetical protein V2H45_14280 [Tumidithrix elongata RA019]|uniref:Uncharacterized protein n=1 Tax=Tumidithrix elongata BACA0141 TaxID=2716417 RepID=A0AAW9PTH5_9CYAN|nr:hypothetical protein [Tumidithrix elongata RA019]